MIIIKIKDNMVEIGGKKIRRQFDPKNNKWCYSIVDVIEIVAESSDARNYWKVLKNRLKKRQNELVTRCNQLKMLSKDGKYYLTDVADTETILDIIKLLSSSDTAPFRRWFNQIES